MRIESAAEDLSALKKAQGEGGCAYLSQGYPGQQVWLFPAQPVEPSCGAEPVLHQLADSAGLPWATDTNTQHGTSAHSCCHKEDLAQLWEGTQLHDLGLGMWQISELSSPLLIWPAMGLHGRSCQQCMTWTHLAGLARCFQPLFFWNVNGSPYSAPPSFSFQVGSLLGLPDPCSPSSLPSPVQILPGQGTGNIKPLCLWGWVLNLSKLVRFSEHKATKKKKRLELGWKEMISLLAVKQLAIVWIELVGPKAAARITHVNTFLLHRRNDE